MEQITHVLEEKRDGTKVVRNFFLCGKKQNVLSKSNSYFTRLEKKVAKLNYKQSLKQNVVHQIRRRELVENIVKQPFPNWNIKLGILKDVL